MPSNTVPSAGHYVADLDETPVAAVDQVDESQKARSTWSDAWDSMRKRPMFWISAVLIVLIVAARTPCLLAHRPPTARAGRTVRHIWRFETRLGCSIAFWTCPTSRT